MGKKSFYFVLPIHAGSELVLGMFLIDRALGGPGGVAGSHFFLVSWAACLAARR